MANNIIKNDAIINNNVPWVRLDEIASIKTGGKNAQDKTAGGKYPFFVRSANIERIDSYSYDGEAILIPGEGGVGSIFHYIDGKFDVHQRVYKISDFAENVCAKYIYHYMREFFGPHATKKSVKATVESLRLPMFKSFSIPLPPLEIQKAIADTLDKFTKLEAELEAELEARVKQYEYYKYYLCNFENSISWMSIGESCDVFDGTHQTPTYTNSGVKFVSVENIDNIKGSNKFIPVDEFEKLYKNKPKKGDVFMTRIGRIGACYVLENDDPLAYYVTLALLRPKQDLIDSYYLKFFLESSIGRKEIRKKTLLQATPIKINLGDISKVRIPVPPLDKQIEISSFLKNFNTLSSDFQSGIPAEIAARRKQYEYYRKKLLTFPGAD